MDIRRVVGRNVRRYRIEAELSQEELAAGMGVEQGYVSRLEAGKRNPTIVEIWHVAEALGVRPAALFRGRAQPSKSTAKQTKTGKPIIQICLPFADILDLTSVASTNRRGRQGPRPQPAICRRRSFQHRRPASQPHEGLRRPVRLDASSWGVLPNGRIFAGLQEGGNSQFLSINPHQLAHPSSTTDR